MHFSQFYTHRVYHYFANILISCFLGAGYGFTQIIQSFPVKLCSLQHHWSSFLVWISDETNRTCDASGFPTFQTNGKDKSLFLDTVLEVLKNVTVPIKVLHVTSMSAYRSDAHVGNWSDNLLFPDCSHWCLPGVPDMWNEIVLFQLYR